MTLSSTSFQQLLRFGLVGVGNTVLNYVVFAVLHFWLLAGQVFIPQSVAYVAGIFWGYYWNSRWTFNAGQFSGPALSRYIVLQFVLLVASAGMMTGLEYGTNLHINLIWFVITAITALLNFLLSKYWIFSDA